METRANYVLIGVCTLIAIVLGLGFFVWLAKFQIDRQYAYYDVFFDNVSGLNRAAEVRYSGLTVGSVQTLDLADNRQGLVRVRIEVAADTPITEGATAQLQAQGVTGQSFVSITPGRERRAAAAQHDERGAGNPRRAIGGAVADPGCAGPAEAIHRAGEGLPEPRQRRKSGACRQHPLQRRQRLGQAAVRPRRLLQHHRHGRAGNRPDRPSPTSSTRSPPRSEPHWARPAPP